jgi:CubicO group peptidase (beta-lactamase class C family)
MRIFVSVFALAVFSASQACTTILVGKKASATGRVLVAHNEDDGGALAVRHGIVPARDWPEGSILPAEPGRASVPQISRTLKFYWSEVKSPKGGPSNADSFLNEKGVYIVSNGAGPSREDAQSSLAEGGVEYNLRRIVAERAVSAQHAVTLITNLVAKYGYAPSGRMYSVADGDEAWCVQIARGRNRFVAVRVPDDEVAVIPNCFTVPGFSEREQAPGRWRSPKDIYRWKYALKALCGGIWTDDRYVFSALPSKKISIDDLKRILSTHYEDDEELIAIPNYKIKEAMLHKGEVVTICTENTIESSVCELYADPLETELHVARGQGCCRPYERFRPFGGGWPDGFMSDIDAAWRIDNHLKPMTADEAIKYAVAYQGVAGAVSVETDASGRLTAVCEGFADVATKRPMAMDTVFALYSVSKSVCGTAVAILVDEGRISLDDEVAKFLPEFRNVKVEVPRKGACGSDFVPPKRAVTVRDLLCHTAGCRLYVPLAHRDVPLREVARLVANTPLKTHPGECFWYNNPSIDAAGAVVEVVSGMSYEKFLQERIFKPLGMKDTTFFPDEEQISRLARCYADVDEGGLRDFTDSGAFERQNVFPVRKKVYACPSAGLFSTPRDFIRYAQMLANRGVFDGKTIISRRTFDATLAVKQTEPHLAVQYTLGNRIRGKWLGHSGTLKTDFGADVSSGRARLFFVQNALLSGERFARSKEAWETATD